jgi:hypothetical protein
MSGPPESPETHTAYQPVILPRVPKAAVILILSGIWLFYSSRVEIQGPFPTDTETALLAVFGILGNVYAHESVHFITSREMGYEPSFVWPNIVIEPNQEIPTTDAVVKLCSPQILSIVYVFLIPQVGAATQFLLVWGLFANFVGGANDFLWSVRRLLWPAETLMTTTTEPRNYVAFPKSHE